MLKKHSDLITILIALPIATAATLLHTLSPVTYPIFGAWSAVVCSIMCLLFALLAGKTTRKSRPVVARLCICSAATLVLSSAAAALPCVVESSPCVFVVTFALACELIMLARFYVCLVDISCDE